MVTDWTMCSLYWGLLPYSSSICNSIYFCSVAVTTLILKLRLVFSKGGGGTGTTVSSSTTLPLPPIAPGSFISTGGAPPSIASLLATPLANLGPSRTAPLVLSSALSPIPGKVVEAIQAGHYVGYKDLLPVNEALKQRVVDAGILGL